jgi:hypothetical protein
MWHRAFARCLAEVGCCRVAKGVRQKRGGLARGEANFQLLAITPSEKPLCDELRLNTPR